MAIPRGQSDEQAATNPNAGCQATETFNLRAYYKVYNAKKRFYF
jgi:hypothetical protein